MEQAPIRPWNSLRWRFSAFLVALIATSSLLQLFFSTKGWRELVEHLEQQANWNLAADVAEKLQPYTKNVSNSKELEKILLGLTIANPKAEFIFLGPSGEILAAIPYRQRTERSAIDLAPLRRALEPDLPNLPLYGDDPYSNRGRKIFSVARLVVNNQPCYLYVPLMSSTFDFFIRNTGQFYLARSIIFGLLVSGLFSLFSGFLLFFFLSRRFRMLGESIARFQHGDFAARAPKVRDDELGRLSEAFNQMAETISENTKELKRKDQLRRELIANISHDLRGPVTSTLTHLEAILGKSLSEAERLEYLGIIQENALSQNRLVEDLFDLSVLEANEERMDKDFCSLQRIAKSVAATLSPLAEKKTQSLTLELPEDLPLVFADSRALQRVLSNLVSNAIRYTPVGGSVRVKASVENSQPGWISVAVSDSGIGIPSEELPFIFESFYRANKHRPEDPGGTGLGLAIVKRLLALHGSEPRVNSVVDQGTTFSFSLPTEEAV